MVKNLLIARKTCRPREEWACLLLKKIYIFLNDRFRLALVKILLLLCKQRDCLLGLKVISL